MLESHIDHFDPSAPPEFLNHTTGKIAIVAGHFSLSPELSELSNEGQTEELTFRSGLALYKALQGQGKETKLYLWINDIGIAPEFRKQLKHDYAIPENYLEAIRNSGLDDLQMDVVFESTMRNKASTLIRKIYKNHPELFEVMPTFDSRLVRCVERTCTTVADADEHAYTISDPDGLPLVLKEGQNPKCNLILATFFETIARDFSPSYIVNIFNSIYTHRLRLGLHVHTAIFDTAINFLTVFYNENGDTFVENKK